jgi:hypothetical protein
MNIYLCFLPSLCSSSWQPEMLGFYLTIHTLVMLIGSAFSMTCFCHQQLIMYDHRSDNVEFTVQKVTLGQVSLPNSSSTVNHPIIGLACIAL